MANGTRRAPRQPGRVTVSRTPVISRAARGSWGSPGPDRPPLEPQQGSRRSSRCWRPCRDTAAFSVAAAVPRGARHRSEREAGQGCWERMGQLGGQRSWGHNTGPPLRLPALSAWGGTLGSERSVCSAASLRQVPPQALPRPTSASMVFPLSGEVLRGPGRLLASCPGRGSLSPHFPSSAKRTFPYSCGGGFGLTCCQGRPSPQVTLFTSVTSLLPGDEPKRSVVGGPGGEC